MPIRKFQCHSSPSSHYFHRYWLLYQLFFYQYTNLSINESILFLLMWILLCYFSEILIRICGALLPNCFIEKVRPYGGMEYALDHIYTTQNRQTNLLFQNVSKKNELRLAISESDEMVEPEIKIIEKGKSKIMLKSMNSYYKFSAIHRSDNVSKTKRAKHRDKSTNFKNAVAKKIGNRIPR